MARRNAPGDMKARKAVTLAPNEVDAVLEALFMQKDADYKYARAASKRGTQLTLIDSAQRRGERLNALASDIIRRAY